MKKIEQYYPNNVEMPELGDVRELIDRKGRVRALGVVYGLFPYKRKAFLRELTLNDCGQIVRVNESH